MTMWGRFTLPRIKKGRSTGSSSLQKLIIDPQERDWNGEYQMSRLNCVCAQEEYLSLPWLWVPETNVVIIRDSQPLPRIDEQIKTLKERAVL